jgi:hypothetical protein
MSSLPLGAVIVSGFVGSGFDDARPLRTEEAGAAVMTNEQPQQCGCEPRPMLASTPIVETAGAHLFPRLAHTAVAQGTDEIVSHLNMRNSVAPRSRRPAPAVAAGALAQAGPCSGQSRRTRQRASHALPRANSGKQRRPEAPGFTGNPLPREARACTLISPCAAAQIHFASWNMMPSVWRWPERRRLTPWRILTR